MTDVASIDFILDALRSANVDHELEVGRDGDAEVYGLRPTRPGAVGIDVRAEGSWAFVSIDDYDGGLEFDLANASDRRDVAELVLSVAEGSATVTCARRRDGLTLLSIALCDGRRLSASVSPMSLVRRRRTVQLVAW